VRNGIEVELKIIACSFRGAAQSKKEILLLPRRPKDGGIRSPLFFSILLRIAVVVVLGNEPKPQISPWTQIPPIMIPRPDVFDGRDGSYLRSTFKKKTRFRGGGGRRGTTA
jgi:hypothetical protein